MARPGGRVLTASPLGATLEGGGTRFCVWAPDAAQIDVRIEEPERREVGLEALGDGYFGGFVEGVRAGALYRYVIHRAGEQPRALPDPASRYQPRGVHGPSEVVAAAHFAWTDEGFPGAPLLGGVPASIYELHAGTFTTEGTFEAAARHLDALVDLGVTTIQLLPVADFDGDRNWGYDGVAHFAPSRAYGRPEDLRALVNRAHELGLAVTLDVVYNHFGPSGAYHGSYSNRYTSSAHHTPWGAAMNLDQPGSEAVRRFFIESALHWLHEYHVDGFRLDATDALVDDSDRHFLAEYAERVHAAAPEGKHVTVIAEDSRNLARIMQRSPEGYALDGVLADDWHHVTRRLLAGDHEGYYQDYAGTTDELARTLERGWIFTGQHSAFQGRARGTEPEGIALPRFVVCLQNHDQVGNRALGDRLHHAIAIEAWRAASTLLLCAAETPLLFMGQEWAASSPFQFFTDHHDDLGRLVTEGRREEFRHWSGFADPEARERIPDPQALATFERSRLDWAEREREPHASTLRLYSALLRLRREEPALRWTEGARQHARALDGDSIALLRRNEHGAVLVLARLRGEGGIEVPADLGGEERWRPVLTTEDTSFAPDARSIDLEGTEGASSARGLAARFERPGAVVLRAAR